MPKARSGKQKIIALIPIFGMLNESRGCNFECSSLVCEILSCKHYCKQPLHSSICATDICKINYNVWLTVKIHVQDDFYIKDDN